MSFEESSIKDETNQVGYRLFREGSVRRFNPSLFAVRKEDSRGWFLVELKEGKWVCDCNTSDVDDNGCHCTRLPNSFVLLRVS